MRVIKFRAWHNGQMVQDVLVSSTGWITKETANLHENVGGRDGVMQYTGLKDKNGVEIYEGDIVRKPGDLWIGNESVGSAKGTFNDDAVIEYVSGSFRLNKLGDDSDNYYGVLEYSTNNMANVLEVIGNIHENPEMLNGDDIGKKDA